MRRSAVLVIMLLAMLWQSLALARIGSTVNVLADRAHAALHWQEEGHVHQDDGSYQQDDSTDAAQHVFSDHMSVTTALMAAASHELPPLASDAPLGTHDAAAPDPTLDGLLRPPRPRF